MTPSSTLIPCHHCDTSRVNTLRTIEGYEELYRVSSDCMPVAPGGELAVCMQCAAVQKPLTNQWQTLIDTIYRQYQIYHQSGGKEQVVFNTQTGQAAGRSLTLLRKLTEPLALSASGRMLDVGCGNGALLAAMGNLYPQWRLTGTELNDQHRQAIESLPGVEAFHTGEAHQTPGQFDLVTLIHVLEHIPHPAVFLRSLSAKLQPAGQLLIEVPDHQRNPFDLLIADHSTHFSPAVLRRVIRQAGLQVKLLERTLIPKELTAAAVLPVQSPSRDDDPEPLSPADALQDVTRHINWLRRFADEARAHACHDPVGVFGTSIAGTWLGATLGDGVAYFVDEDTSRHDRPFMGKPVLAPTDRAARQAKVILALPHWLATQVATRLQDTGIEWILPPAPESV